METTETDPDGNLLARDQHLGCSDMKPLPRDLAHAGPRPDLRVAGASSGAAKPILAHKGKRDLTVTAHGLPSLASEPSKRITAVRAADQATVPAARQQCRRHTEGGFFQAAGIPRDSGRAHQPDAWAAETRLQICDSFTRRLAGRPFV